MNIVFNPLQGLVKWTAPVVLTIAATVSTVSLAKTGGRVSNDRSQSILVVVDSGAVSAEVSLNDIPIAHTDPGQPQAQLTVHEYLIPGKNLIDLVVKPALRTGSSKAGFVTLKVLQAPPNVFPDDASVVVMTSLAIKVDPGKSASSHLTEKREFLAPDWVKPSALLKAQKITPADLERAFEALQTIQAGLNRGDPEPYLALADVKIAEVSEAYQLPAKQAVDGFRKQLARIAAEPGFAMEPISKKTLALSVRGGGRVVDAVDARGEPALRSKKNAKGIVRYQLPTKLIFVGGKLHVFR